MHVVTISLYICIHHITVTSATPMHGYSCVMFLLVLGLVFMFCVYFLVALTSVITTNNPLCVSLWRGCWKLLLYLVA